MAPFGAILTKFSNSIVMKGLILVVLLSTPILFMSCEKEKVEKEIEEKLDLEMFLSETELQFKGKVIEEDVNWLFSNWQNGIGGYSESFWCLTEDKKIQQRNFAIYDSAQREKIISIKIKSPAFNIDSSFAFIKTIFDLGNKNIRNPEDGIFDGFDIEVLSTCGFFSTLYGDQNLSSLEVLKLVEEEDQDNYKEIKVWFLISCNLYKPNGELAGKIKNGMLLGYFFFVGNGNFEDDKHLKFELPMHAEDEAYVWQL